MNAPKSATAPFDEAKWAASVRIPGARGMRQRRQHAARHALRWLAFGLAEISAYVGGIVLSIHVSLGVVILILPSAGEIASSRQFYWLFPVPPPWHCITIGGAVLVFAVLPRDLIERLSLRGSAEWMLIRRLAFSKRADGVRQLERVLARSVPFALYLRSFRNEVLASEAFSYMAHDHVGATEMTAYRVIERAYDTALIARLAPELVTVALANVNDATPVRDVITLFLTDKWQDAVGEIARRAAVTVVVLGEFTEGLAAELRMLHEAQLHGRVVLLMHKTDPRWYGLGLLDQFANQFDYADGVQAHAVASQIKRLTGLGKADGAITKQSGNA